MYHPTTRVLTILELLQARSSLSGAELAERLEVDRRTVRRYIAMLQDLGIPIEATRGPYGGYRLRRGFKLPPLMLTDDEALAITLSLFAARRSGMAADLLTVESALAKIERVLPEELRARVQAVQSVVSFQSAPAAPQPQGQIVSTLSLAAHQQRRVELHYRSRDGETVRRFDPYGLAYHWSRWYVVGWCHLRQDVRVFRLDRVVAVELQAETFTPPVGFDSFQYVLDSLALAPWEWSAEVLLETSLEDAQRRIPLGSALVEQAAAGVLVRVHVDSLEWLACMLLSLGCRFVVHQPPELRDALRQVATSAAAMAQRVEEANLDG